MEVWKPPCSLKEAKDASYNIQGQSLRYSERKNINLRSREYNINDVSIDCVFQKPSCSSKYILYRKLLHFIQQFMLKSQLLKNMSKLIT